MGQHTDGTVRFTAASTRSATVTAVGIILYSYLLLYRCGIEKKRSLEHKNGRDKSTIRGGGDADWLAHRHPSRKPHL
uniref:Uncharacterized protein n=1 Tax=Oryza brachyantha TaxID=4533 RepID=J3M6T9_ORYBR